jgi:hypothetical protein
VGSVDIYIFMNKEILPDQTILLTEVIIKVAAIERLLVKSGVISNEELIDEIKKIAKEISGFIAAKNFDNLKIENKN